MTWTNVGTVNTDTFSGILTPFQVTIHIPAGVQGGDVITVGVCFTTGGTATTFSLPGFTASPGLFTGARSAAHDQMWGGYRIAAGAAGGATTDTTFTATFGATVWGEAVTQVERSTLGAGTVTSAVFNTAAAYQTACPDPTFSPGAGDLSVWFYAGQNLALGTTASTFSGTGPSALSNFVQVGITGNGGGVGVGWKAGTGSPGGATANQAVDPTDFVIGVTEAAATRMNPHVTSQYGGLF